MTTHIIQKEILNLYNMINSIKSNLIPFEPWNYPCVKLYQKQNGFPYRFQVMIRFSFSGAQRITENMVICTFSTKKHIEQYDDYSLAWPKEFWQKDIMNLNTYLIQVKTNGTVQKRFNQYHQETHQKIHSRWCLHRSLLFIIISAWNVKRHIHPGNKKRQCKPWHVTPPKSIMCALKVSKVNWP